MAFRESKRGKKVTLNVTPLIDVLFLLLIFFMITGTFKRTGEMELKLPESSTASPVREGAQSHQSELVLREDGKVFLNGSEVSIENLERSLHALVEADEEAEILLEAESGAQHGEVVRLLDKVREAGFPGVSIGTRMRAAEGSQQ
jgi:biopolymer transport protein ExbD